MSDQPPSLELQEHFRYPEDLFRIQTDMWGRYRINGAVMSYPGFADAFECAEGTPMNPEEACEVW